MPLETRILLLRHAETAAPDLFHGSESDVSLGDRGRLQAEAAAPWLAAQNPGAIYSSGLLRARQTAAPIASAAGLEPRILDEIHERRMGPLSGRPRSEGNAAYFETSARWKAGDLGATHPGAESFAEIRGRVVPAFRRVAADHRGETVVVVAHGVVNKVAICSLVEGLGPADYDRVGIDFVAVHDLRAPEDGPWKLAGPEDLEGARR